MKRDEVQPGDILVLDGERLYVREVDRSVLSRNLGYLVCPAELYLAHDDDAGSHWLPATTKDLRRESPSVVEITAMRVAAAALRESAARLPGRAKLRHKMEAQAVLVARRADRDAERVGVQAEGQERFNEIEAEAEYQRALLIIERLTVWEQDRHDPPSLRLGCKRPSDSEIVWARAVVAPRAQSLDAPGAGG